MANIVSICQQLIQKLHRMCVWVCILFVNRILLGSERGSSRSNCKIGWKIPDFIEYENLL